LCKANEWLGKILTVNFHVKKNKELTSKFFKVMFLCVPLLLGLLGRDKVKELHRVTGRFCNRVHFQKAESDDNQSN